jgi:hypothetical protein
LQKYKHLEEPQQRTSVVRPAAAASAMGTMGLKGPEQDDEGLGKGSTKRGGPKESTLHSLFVRKQTRLGPSSSLLFTLLTNSYLLGVSPPALVSGTFLVSLG